MLEKVVERFIEGKGEKLADEVINERA